KGKKLYAAVFQIRGDDRCAVFVEPHTRGIRTPAGKGTDLRPEDRVADGDQLLTAVEIVAEKDAVGGVGRAGDGIKRRSVCRDAKIPIDRERAADLRKRLFVTQQHFVGIADPAKEAGVRRRLIGKTERAADGRPPGGSI